MKTVCRTKTTPRPVHPITEVRRELRDLKEEYSAWKTAALILGFVASVSTGALVAVLSAVM